jgi:hypothetical protein
VVPFPLNHRGFNAFHFTPSRAAVFASYSKMKHSLLFLFLVGTSLSPRSLSAQARPPSFPPSVMRSAYGEKLHVPGIPNSGRINDHLYRGAQPGWQGLAELRKLGITTVVDLRGEAGGSIPFPLPQ